MNRVTADIHEIIKNQDLFLPLNHKTVLVTGATGLIGSMIVKSILAANKEYSLSIRVIGQIRDFKKAETVFGTSYPSVEFITNLSVQCDYIIHTVSPTASRFFIEHPVETIEVSVNSTMAILEMARANNASVVYLSSMEEYGVPYKTGQIMTENQVGIIDHMNVRSSYSESKRLCECLCASYASEYDVDVKIARLAQTVGAGVSPSDNRMPIQFARSVIEGRDIVLHTEGKSVSNFVYLSDAVTGILTIMHKGKAGQAYNICNDSESKSVWDIANIVAKDIAAGRIGVRIEIPKEKMGYAPDNTMRLDSEKLRQLGWRPRVDLQRAYEKLVDYLSNEIVKA